MSMFCYQCEQAAKGVGCTQFGVCGKDPEVAALQDLLIHAVKGISMYAHRAARLGVSDLSVDRFVIEALFSTVTNVNFDAARFRLLLSKASEVKESARAMYSKACVKSGNLEDTLAGPAMWQPETNPDRLAAEGREVGVDARIAERGADAAGLEELMMYGLKGMAAYADHAMILGHEDRAVYAFFHEALDFLTKADNTVDDLAGMVNRCGEVNLRIMQLLDSANTGAYGHPEPTSVRIEPVKGKAILVSGHDLKDLDALLKQTEGRNINVYTHSEMLPAHGYPKLKKYKHLAGNYGGAWQDQVSEFDAFPGPVLMTTNCIQRPRESYKGRIFSSGLVGWPGVAHVSNQDFTPVIEAAEQSEGFKEDGPDRTITVGFGHEAMLNVAGEVVAAVKSGKIRRFFLIGGCDGAKPGRNYFTEFAEAVPEDCVILTLACGKYRFNKMDFGDIGGIPRLLDCGQCNDAYSAIQIAVALAEALDTDVRSLPLSIICSWFEQKAVCVLLTLLYLGMRNIRLGPSMPAFITPPVVKMLNEKYNIAPIGSVADDLAMCMQQ